ncbi:MAG: cyclic nucleotide-binding domain-containing protein [Planctomycetes bacterium]|nr:cyclic nucleotide-binding domain-containing protein [Planctomycetota bacterium]
MNARDALVREYAPGELICRQGAIADRGLLLKQGSLRATVVPEKELDGADAGRLSRGTAVGMYTQAGSFLGCEGALLGHYIESLFAADTVVVVEVPLNAISVMSAVTEDTAFGLSLARSVARRLVAANKSLGSGQRTANRFLRDLQGLCADFYNLVQRIPEDAEGEDAVLQALSAAKRTFAYSTGEVGGAEVTKQTRRIMARAVDEQNLIGNQQRLKKGELLCRKGDPGTQVFLLLSGRLSVRIGNEQFGVVRPGETVGEIGALLGDEEPRRIADIQAEEPSTALVIPTEQFPKMVQQQPKLLVNLCKLLTLRVKGFEQLSCESSDALRAVASRFAPEKAPFASDVAALREQLELLIEEHDLPLQMEVENLQRMAERWEARASELNDKLAAVARA